VADAAEGDLRAVEHIVSQFLAFVQGDRDAGLGQPESVRALVQQVVASYAEQGRQVTFAADATDAQAPDLAVTRLLHNLIDNALAHGAEPVQVVWRAPTADERELTVWDSGPGLSDAEFARALQPFVRLSADTSIGHCGLGLAIVAQVARQWGAQLEGRRDGSGRFGVAVAWRLAPADAHSKG
jgi:two-component system, OmpR family, osmolarity sensor histidine kinase EnvZ